MAINSDGLVEVIGLRRASGFRDRLIGLIAHPSSAFSTGFLIERCRAVHTFWMRWPIDVVFLSASGVVLEVRERMTPWRFAFCFAARDVLELSGGSSSRLALRPGVRVRIEGETIRVERAPVGVSL